MNDLISRKWLLDLYDTPKDGDDVEWKVPLEVVRQNILDAPSADAAQGEWVGFDECSLCGKQAFDFIEGCVDGLEYLPNFCPNCGARMRGENE